MKYTLAITDNNLKMNFTYFEDLDDARAALKELVRNPIKEYIKDFSTEPDLVIQRIGKKKKIYTHQLPYDITSGEDYVALSIKENQQFIIGGVIAETTKIDRILADNTSYANISFESMFDDDEEN